MSHIKDFEEEYKKLAEKHMELATHYKSLEAQMGELKEFTMRVKEVIGIDKRGMQTRLNVREVSNSPIGVSIRVDL